MMVITLGSTPLAMGCGDRESSSVWVCLQGVHGKDRLRGGDRTEQTALARVGAWSRPPEPGKSEQEEEG